MQDRAKIAHSAGKPIVLGETGMTMGYMSSRDTYLQVSRNWHLH